MCRGQVVIILGLLVGRACAAAPPKTSTPRVHAVKPQRSKPERHQRGVQHRFSKMPRHTTHPNQRVASPAVNQSTIGLGPGYPTFNVTIDNENFCDPVAETKPLLSINKMTMQQRAKVSAAISKTITPARVQHHYWLNHEDADQFLDGHRRYLACVKREVAKSGLQLPVWSPNRTVPKALFVVEQSPKNCSTDDDAISCPGGWYYESLQIAHVAMMTPVNLTMPAVCNLRTKQAFYLELIDWHNQVHATVGGTMDTFDSPASPLFWPWHNYVDSLYADFQKCNRTGARGKARNAGRKGGHDGSRKRPT